VVRSIVESPKEANAVPSKGTLDKEGLGASA